MAPSGLPFWPFDPKPRDVRLEDIAHHLSRSCRFTGGTREFYSVAQHCVLGARHLQRDHRTAAARYFLLHDGSEAYLSDIARPVKRDPRFAFYRAIEEDVQQAVYAAFGLIDLEPEAVAHMDRALLRTEQRDLMPAPLPGEDRGDVLPLPTRIVPWPSNFARGQFLQVAHELGLREVAR